MDLAVEDPGMFGASIVFDLDRGEMERFKAKYTDKEGTFTSPDEDNARQYPHARLSKLYAADLVDDPAANADGLFSCEGGELAARAEHILLFAMGLREEAPDEIEFGPHPERAKAFLTDFLERHGLRIVSREKFDEMREELTGAVLALEVNRKQREISRLFFEQRQTEAELAL